MIKLGDLLLAVMACAWGVDSADLYSMTHAPVTSVNVVKSVPLHKQEEYNIYRRFAYSAAGLPSMAEARTINCHEAFLHIISEKYEIAHPLPRVRASFDGSYPLPNEEVETTDTQKFCYFSFMIDDFEKFSGKYRPVVAYPMYRSSLLAPGDLSIFGKKGGAYASESCMWWGDAKNPEFKSTIGYTIYPQEHHPNIYVEGSFGLGTSTRPFGELQQFEWVVQYHSGQTGGENDVSPLTLAKGNFTLQRLNEREKKSMVHAGFLEVPRIQLYGFEEGWIGVFLHLTYDYGFSDQSVEKNVISVCDDDLKFTFFDGDSGNHIDEGENEALDEVTDVTCEGDGDDSEAVAIATAHGVADITSCVTGEAAGLCSYSDFSTFCCASCASLDRNLLALQKGPAKADQSRKERLIKQQHTAGAKQRAKEKLLHEQQARKSVGKKTGPSIHIKDMHTGPTEKEKQQAETKAAYDAMVASGQVTSAHRHHPSSAFTEALKPAAVSTGTAKAAEPKKVAGRLARTQ